MNIPGVIASELSITEQQVQTVIALFDDEATVPFIARYRKEKTGGLDEEQLRSIEERLTYLTLLEDRKATVLKSIEEQGKLTDELKDKINASLKLQEVEDLYLPYKPKKRTKGTIAKQKGLEPLAMFMLDTPDFDGDFEAKLAEFVDAGKGVNNTDEALEGAKDIIAEMVAETAEVRQIVREILLEESFLSSKKAVIKAPAEGKKKKQKKDVYEIYHDFKCFIPDLKAYQILAINRGEKEKFLKVTFDYDYPMVLQEVYYSFFNYEESYFLEELMDVTVDAFQRLIYPSLEREVRKELTARADDHAIEIFASNLRQLLLQSPISNKTIIGIDPGFVSGCKVAVIDPTGKYVEGTTIFPHAPKKKIEDSKATLTELITKHDVNLIAIGNGTASRETELMVADVIREMEQDVHYLIVNEAGASVYSASPIAKQEFPELEASMRGNISIARRVLDPLAELVKITPKSIGVGLYQHDVDQKSLTKKLDDIVVSCVNYVGVDLNTASSALLTYVSGLNKRMANNIVTYRESIGKFTSRKQLLEVPGLGEKAFEQAAGFLKIPGGENPLDNTFIHPESYPETERLLDVTGIGTTEVNEKGELVKTYVEKNGIDKVSENVGLGELTLQDIIENILKPGRDPREDMPTPILRSDVLKMEDLQPGMKLKGTVRNIVDFGAFVDIGVKQDGLLHISKMTNKYVKNPLDELNVADIVEVTVLEVNAEKGRISLSMRDEKAFAAPEEKTEEVVEEA